MRITGVLAGWVACVVAGSVTARAIVVNPPTADFTNISFVQWTSATLGTPGGAVGSLVISNLGTVDVTFSGEVAAPTQVGQTGPINYWAPTTPFLSNVISNLPPSTDIIVLVGGNTILNTITFSVPVMDPVMLVNSLGQAGTPVDYQFDQPFEILSHGAGYWGDGILTKLDNNVLHGVEGTGAIQFSGLYTDLSWVVPSGEFWHGFTIGAPLAARVAAVPEGQVWFAGALASGIAVYSLRRRRSVNRGNGE